MQSPLHHPRGTPAKNQPQTFIRFRNACLPAIAFLALCAPVAVRAQQTQVPNTNGVPDRLPGIDPSNETAPDPSMRRMVSQMALKRNTQRQQRIVADSAHLLDLAQKLNAEVSKSDKNTLSLSVVKEADEIEKLAKSIKDKMRDGQ